MASGNRKPKTSKQPAPTHKKAGNGTPARPVALLAMAGVIAAAVTLFVVNSGHDNPDSPASAASPARAAQNSQGGMMPGNNSSGGMASHQQAGIFDPARVKIPELPPFAAQGRQAWQRVCATCHGELATGTDQGPPLLHRFYHPGHHGDAAFVRAAQQGVRAHHWQFGDMPAQPGASGDDIMKIIAWIRILQKENGIF